MRKVLSVVGTRPNLMKTAPVVAALERRGVDQVLVHTGQHYDAVMSDVFFRELAIREPDHFLEVGSGTHAQQTARVMERLEPVLVDEQPDVVLVPGDVNSTAAAAMVAAKLDIPVAHLEAGLRSFDRTMPEEINRIVTDSISELLFIHSPEARDNLLHEGHAEQSIHYVGNTMIDSLVAMRDQIAAPQGRQQLVVTLHRPALVDGPLLREVVDQLNTLATQMPIVFPVHPRTRAAMDAQGLELAGTIDPVGYLEFLGLVADAAAVLTDSGGIQEETTYLGIPCFTLRDNTERPVTVELGTNVLLGLRPERIAELPALIEQTRSRAASVPPYWDGTAAERVADVLASQAPIRRRS
jgi:UDP-N-acetylglucosamine 2-epimerase (non-hydrolysing)